MELKCVISTKRYFPKIDKCAESWDVDEILCIFDDEKSTIEYVENIDEQFIANYLSKDYIIGSQQSKWDVHKKIRYDGEIIFLCECNDADEDIEVSIRIDLHSLNTPTWKGIFRK